MHITRVKTAFFSDKHPPFTHDLYNRKIEIGDKVIYSSSKGPSQIDRIQRLEIGHIEKIDIEAFNLELVHTNKEYIPILPLYYIKRVKDGRIVKITAHQGRIYIIRKKRNRR